MTTQEDQSEAMANQLENVDSQTRCRKHLQHMATIDLGSLQLEFEDHHMMNRSTSQEEPYPSLRIVQNKEFWYKTSPKEKRKKALLVKIPRSKSMDFNDHSEESDVQPKVLKLPSETDIHELPNMTWLGYPSSHISFLSNPGIW